MGFSKKNSNLFVPVHIDKSVQSMKFKIRSISMKFHNVPSFEENSLTLNYQFSILFGETLKFVACMNTYSWK